MKGRNPTAEEVRAQPLNDYNGAPFLCWGGDPDRRGHHIGYFKLTGRVPGGQAPGWLMPENVAAWAPLPAPPHRFPRRRS